MEKFNLSKQKKLKIAQMNFVSVLDEEDQKNFNGRLLELSRDIPHHILINFATNVVDPLNQEFLQQKERSISPQQIEDKAREIADRILMALEQQKTQQIHPTPVETPQTHVEKPYIQETSGIFDQYIRENIIFEEDRTVLVKTSNFSSPPQKILDNFDEFNIYLENRLSDITGREDNEALASVFRQSMMDVMSKVEISQQLSPEQIDTAWQKIMAAPPGDNKFKQQLADYVYNKKAVLVHGKKIVQGLYSEPAIVDTSRQALRMRASLMQLMSENFELRSWYKSNELNIDEGLNKALSQKYVPVRDSKVPPDYYLFDKEDGRISFLLNDKNVLQEYNAVFPCSDLMKIYDVYKYKKSELYSNISEAIINCSDNNLEAFIDTMIDNEDARIIAWVQQNVGALGKGEKMKDKKKKELVVRKDDAEGKGQYEREGQSYDASTGAGLSLEEEQKYRETARKILLEEFVQIKTIVDDVIPAIYRMGVEKGDPNKIRKSNTLKFLVELYKQRLNLIVDRGKFTVKDIREQGKGKIILKFFFPKNVEKRNEIDLNKANDPEYGYMTVTFDPNERSGVSQIDFRKLITRWGDINVSLEAVDNKKGYQEAVNNFQKILSDQISIIDRIKQKFVNFVGTMGRNTLRDSFDQIVGELDNYMDRVVNELNADSGLEEYDAETVKYLLMEGKQDLILHHQIPSPEKYEQNDNETRRLKRVCLDLMLKYPDASDQNYYNGLLFYKIQNNMNLAGLSLKDISKIRTKVRKLRKQEEQNLLKQVLEKSKDITYGRSYSQLGKKIQTEIKRRHHNKIREESRNIRAKIVNYMDIRERDPIQQQIDYERTYGTIDEQTGDMDERRAKEYAKLLRNVKGDELRYDIFNWLRVFLDLLTRNEIRFESLKTFFKVIGPQFKVFLPIEEERTRNLRPGSPHARKTPIAMYLMQKPLIAFGLDRHRNAIQKYMSDGVGGLTDSEGRPIKDQVGIWATDDEDGEFVKWVWQQIKTGNFVVPSQDVIQYMINRLDKNNPSGKTAEFSYFRAKKKIAKLLNIKKSMIKLSSKTQQIDDSIRKVKFDYFEELHRYLDWGEKYDQDFSYLPLWQYRL